MGTHNILEKSCYNLLLICYFERFCNLEKMLEGGKKGQSLQISRLEQSLNHMRLLISHGWVVVQNSSLVLQLEL